MSANLAARRAARILRLQKLEGVARRKWAKFENRPFYACPAPCKQCLEPSDRATRDNTCLTCWPELRDMLLGKRRGDYKG